MSFQDSAQSCPDQIREIWREWEWRSNNNDISTACNVIDREEMVRMKDSRDFPTLTQWISLENIESMN